MCQRITVEELEQRENGTLQIVDIRAESDYARGAV